MLKEKARLFHFLNRFVDYLLLFLSIGIAVQFERLYHGKVIYLLDFISFSPFLIPIILIVWQTLFHYLERDILYRRTTYFILWVMTS